MNSETAETVLYFDNGNNTLEIPDLDKWECINVHLKAGTKHLTNQYHIIQNNSKSSSYATNTMFTLPESVVVIIET